MTAMWTNQNLRFNSAQPQPTNQICWQYAIEIIHFLSKTKVWTLFTSCFQLPTWKTSELCCKHKKQQFFLKCFKEIHHLTSFFLWIFCNEKVSVKRPTLLTLCQKGEGCMCIYLFCQAGRRMTQVRQWCVMGYRAVSCVWVTSAFLHPTVTLQSRRRSSKAAKSGFMFWKIICSSAVLFKILIFW